MGDLRNKFRKDAERAAHEALMAKLYPPKPEAAPARCLCGLTHLEVPIMWAIEVERWPRKVGIFCPACIPSKYLHLVIWDVANLPDDV